MLYCFDMDGTLISSYMDDPQKRYDVWEPLPGRIEKLARLQAEGHTLCIVTNQGGVAFGYTPSLDAFRKVDAVARQFGLVSENQLHRPLVYACFSHPDGKAPWNDPADSARRKPSGAMIREAMAAHPEAAAQGVVFVGDRPEDEAAARDAGVTFIGPDQFDAFFGVAA